MKMKTNTRPPTPRRAPRRLPPRRVLPARAATSEEEFDEYENESEPNMKLSHAFIVVLVLHVLAVGGVFAFNSLKTHQSTPDRKEKSAAVSQPEPKVETTPPPAPVVQKQVPQEIAIPGATYTVVAGDTLRRIAGLHKTSVEALEKANDLTPGATIRVGQVLKLPSTAAKSAEAPKPAIKPVAATTAPSAKPEAVKTEVAKTVEAKPVTKPAVEAKPAAAAPVAAAKEAPKTTAPAVTEPASSKTYVVAKGDNPYSIAKKLKVSYNDLIKANNIEDPTKLQIGQKLIVP